MRRILKIAVGTVVALLILAAVAWLAVDSLARTAIERGATYALGVPTHVDSVDVGLLGGHVRVEGLTVANPPGFQTPHLMKSGRLDVQADPGSLLGDTVVANRFELDGLDLHVEQKLGGSNISTVLENIKSKAGEKPEETEEGAGRKVRVDRIVLRNVVAHVQVLPVGGEATTLNVEVPEIVLEGVTSDNAGGVAIGELTRRLVPAILAAVVSKGKGVLPDADLSRLSGDVASAAQALGAGAGRLVHQIGGDAAKTLEGLGSKVKEAGESLKKGLGDALRGILGGRKEPDAPPGKVD